MCEGKKIKNKTISWFSDFQAPLYNSGDSPLVFEGYEGYEDQNIFIFLITHKVILHDIKWEH